MKKIVVLILFTLIFSSVSFAGTHYVSPTGSATWANSTDIATPCSLITARSNVVAGDIVNLRGGTYSSGLHVMSKNGVVGNPITFQAYTGETPVINNTTTAYWSGRYHSLLLYNSKYIKISGITFQRAAGTYLFQAVYGSKYNEIADCIFDGSNVGNTVNMWCGNSSGCTTTQAATHNWIHGCTFKNFMSFAVSGTTVTGENMGFQLGTVAYDNISNYNTFENNTFYVNGHHNMEVFSKYNVFRNNFFHQAPGIANPNGYTIPYAADSNGRWGHRLFQLYDGLSQDGMFDLLEGNRFGPAMQPPENDGGDGLTICSPKNIIRYNEMYNSQNNGVLFKIGTGSYSNNNRFYNNTVYRNGRYYSGSGQWQGYDVRWYVSEDKNKTVSTIVGVSGTVTVTMVSNHVFNSGQNVVISGTTNYDGTYSITNTGAKTFTFSKAGDIAQETSGYVTGKTFGANNTIKNNIFYNGTSGNMNYGGYTSWITGANTVSNNWLTASGDPIFTDGTLTAITETQLVTVPDLTLQAGSPAINAGVALTTTVGTGASSTTLIVADALYFQDGTWGSDLVRAAGTMVADWIAVGTVANTVQISSINYATNTITLASPISWSNGASVWLYKKSDGVVVLNGGAPDLGAHETSGTDAVYALTVTKAGTGTGAVTSSPVGVDCGSTCSFNYTSGTEVTLSATPAGDDTLTWSGEGCSGSGTCVVTLSQARNPTATFTKVPNHVTISYAGTGTGATDPVAGVYQYDDDATATTTQTPATHSTFTSWSGTCGCTGTGACAPSITSDCTIISTWTADTAYSLTVTPPTTGETVMADSGTINCAANTTGRCSDLYYSGTVNLSIYCATGYYNPVFSGDCSGSTCVLNMNASHTVGTSCTNGRRVKLGGTGRMKMGGSGHIGTP
jgi:hypothetical protein